MVSGMEFNSARKCRIVKSLSNKKEVVCGGKYHVWRCVEEEVVC